MSHKDLPVPQAAREEMDSLGYIKEDQAEVDAWIRSISASVIAAHLRFLAETASQCRRPDIAQWLRDEADEVTR